MKTYSLINKSDDKHYPFGTVVREHRSPLDEEEIAEFKYMEDARSFIKYKEGRENT